MTWITLEKCNIKNMCKKELVKPNSPLSIKEIKVMISNFPIKKTLGPHGLTGKFNKEIEK